MSFTDDQAREHLRLSEDAAHRLLARAIELDHTRSDGTTVSELRDVAREAGISVQAFDAALRELDGRVAQRERVPSELLIPEAIGFWHRTWENLQGDRVVSGRSDSSSGGLGKVFAVWQALINNAGAALLGWLVLLLLTRFTVNGPWLGMDATMIVGCAVGAVIARRLRARITEVGAIGCAVWLFAETVHRLLYHGAQVREHWLGMIAALVGVTVGIALAGRRGATPSETARSVIATVAPTPNDTVPPPARIGFELRALRLHRV